MLCLLLWQVHLGSVYPVSSSSKRWVWVQCCPPNTTPDSGMWRYTTHARAAPCPPSIYPPTSEQQTTPPPHPYYSFHPQHVFYPQWIVPVSTASTDQPTGQMSLPSVIEITPPPSVKGAGHDSSSNGSGGSSHLSTPLDSSLSVHNLIGGSC